MSSLIGVAGVKPPCPDRNFFLIVSFPWVTRFSSRSARGRRDEGAVPEVRGRHEREATDEAGQADGGLEEHGEAVEADHFGADPDKVHWGDVGTLEDYARHLRRITDAAFKEGEHAE